MNEKWWHWHWDKDTVHNVSITYTTFSRWRMGWITLYKFVEPLSTEWKLFLPFNLCVGISLNGK